MIYSWNYWIKLTDILVLYKVNIFRVDQKAYMPVNIEMFTSISLIISFSKILFHISDVKPDQRAIPKVKPAGIYN